MPSEDAYNKPSRRRLAPDERRKQLIGIGLEELSTTPIHQLSIDRVAERAGISRGLLFRYFPTKQHFYIEVVAAANRRLLRYTAPNPELSTQEQIEHIVREFTAFIGRHRDTYTAFVHGGFGTDNDLADIRENSRNTLADRVIESLHLIRSDPKEIDKELILVRSWWALVESLALDAAQENGIDIITNSIDVLVTLLGLSNLN